MANFFEGLLNIAKHPFDEAKYMLKQTKEVGKPLIKGDLGEAFGQFKGSFGEHNKMMSENIAKPLGGDNRLTRNPDATAGGILASIFAAPALMGGGAAGGGGGGTAGGMGGAQGLGWQGGATMNLGSTGYAPTTAFGQSAAASAPSASSVGAMGMPTAYTPTTAFGAGATWTPSATPTSSAYDKWSQISKMQQQQAQQSEADRYKPSAMNPQISKEQLQRIIDNMLRGRTGV